MVSPCFVRLHYRQEQGAENFFIILFTGQEGFWWRLCTLHCMLLLFTSVLSPWTVY